MGKREKYIADIRQEHPEAPEELIALCVELHDYDKATHYADLLGACNNYADIAEKVIRPMYVSGDIDDTKAVKESFIQKLLPLACLDVEGKAHSAVHHVKKMLDGKNVRNERQRLDDKRRELWHKAEETKAKMQVNLSDRVIIEITDTEAMQMFIEFMQSAGTRMRIEESRHFCGPSTTPQPKEHIVIEESPQWLLAALADLQAHCSDANYWNYSFESDWITRNDITLAETISLIRQDLP